MSDRDDLRAARIDELRDGKAKLRERRRHASLDEKLRELVRLQHLYVQIVSTRRPLKAWERPWVEINDEPR